MPKNLVQELNYFSQAVTTSEDNQSAWLGLGLSQALAGDVELAIDTWNTSKIDPALLSQYGAQARKTGDYDLALSLYRAGEQLEGADNSLSSLLAGSVCRRTFASQEALNRSNAAYCADFLQNNENNLIVDGKFSSQEIYGWEGQHFFIGMNAARVNVAAEGSEGNSVLKYIGQDASYHNGLYQKVSLEPGTEVQFSGRFRLSGSENLEARLLYVGWQTKDGTSQGNFGEQIIQDLEWREFSRTFRVPESQDSTFDFYPLIFSGEGTIWVDDIQLKVISD
ncbi:MAG: carbohydrate binding domain-containing protein [Candidatus Promineifilaceae bacterium]|nr:carbohydrate binding domain-containing protein [Candidatus Promineifilaceae bacterium]